MKLRSMLARQRPGFVLGLAAFALMASAHGATPQSWWLDIANDRGPTIKEQLRRGADPNAKDADELPGLMLAIRSGAWRVYDALLANRRTDINVQNKHGETPLMYLALVGETERAEALIKRGAQVNRLGWTPLHYAASKGRADTARMLLGKGAMVNAPAPDGTTPLMMAAYSGNRDMVQLLLDHGADATAVNLQKLTAADWARERKNSRLAEELDEVAGRITAKREGREVVKPVPRETKGGGGSQYFDLDRFERQD